MRYIFLFFIFFISCNEPENLSPDEDFTNKISNGFPESITND
jgi:hypothetical protein